MIDKTTITSRCKLLMYLGRNYQLYILLTLIISFYSLIAGFLFPIIFALLLNTVREQYFKKFIQTTGEKGTPRADIGNSHSMTDNRGEQIL